MKHGTNKEYNGKDLYACKKNMDGFRRKGSDVEIAYAIARKGNQFADEKLSELIGGKSELIIMDDIESAEDCDIFIDCTNAETFMSSSYSKYEKMQKPLIIATTAFSQEDIEKK